MKFLISGLLISCCLSSSAQTNAIDKLFEDYSHDQRATVINISKGLFNLFSTDTDSPINGSLRLLVLEDVHLESSFYDELSEVIFSKEYEILMNTQDKDDKFSMLQKKDRSEYLMVVSNKDENILVQFQGSWLQTQVKDIVQSGMMNSFTSDDVKSSIQDVLDRAYEEGR